jgi:hypothetical protein
MRSVDGCCERSAYTEVASSAALDRAGDGVEAMDDLEINALVARLSRPHASGGVVIERAAILAAGTDFPAVMNWITAHAGTPDTAVSATRGRGLHGSRITDGDATASRPPSRFVLPAGALH